MDIRRPAAIGSGIIAFGLVVAWMVPPTTPIAPQGMGAAYARPLGKTPAPIPPDMTQTYASYAPPAAEPSAPVDRAAIGRDDGYAYNPARDDMPDRMADQYAEDDPQQDFDKGYRWAERRQADDPRACRRFAYTPRGDGCLAFVQDAQEKADRADDSRDENTADDTQ